MPKPVLVIGNKNYSSWSMRPWLALRKAGVDFDERLIPLDTPQFAEEIADYSPTRRVPVLWDQGICIWDSLAICEYVNERWAAGSLWPEDVQQRAQARAISAEMHAGFAALRECMPMNCRASDRHVTIDGELEQDINRVLSLWRECRETVATEGPWLFGAFSIADAMYAPVVSRFNTYGVEMPEQLQAYVETQLADADMVEWFEAAHTEVEQIEAGEAGS
ncbi:MAG: glutathione S-transferase family protein [Halieaceae bacterium]